MSDNPIVTIVIPTFNRAYILPRAINSVLKQLFTGWELLIVDDGSMDETEKLVGSYSDTRIRYLRNAYSKGAGAARNYGMDKARGKYIAFLDSDDVWFPEHLTECLEVLEKENVNICFGLWHDQQNGRVLPGFPNAFMLRMLLSELKPVQKGHYYIFDHSFCEYVIIRGFFLFQTSTLVFNKSVIEKSGKFDEGFLTAEDVDLFFRMTIRQNIGLVYKAHALYCEGNDNLCFYEGSQRTNLSEELYKKQLAHYKSLIRCYWKIQRIIKTSDELVFKKLMMRTNYRRIYEILGVMIRLTEGRNKRLNQIYKLACRYYQYRYEKTPSCGHRFFYFSVSGRFQHSHISYLNWDKIRRDKSSENSVSGKIFFLAFENYVVPEFSDNHVVLYDVVRESKLRLSSPLFAAIEQSNKLKINIKELKNEEVLRDLDLIYRHSFGGLINDIDKGIPVFSENSLVVQQPRQKVYERIHNFKKITCLN